jgi:hypothetical protein
MIEKKKILITTYFFYPSNTPRAFRITALAKCLSQKGYTVTVVTNTKYDFETFSAETGIEVISIAEKVSLTPVKTVSFEALHTNSTTLFENIVSRFKTSIRKLLLFLLPDGHLFSFAFKLCLQLKKLKVNEFDVVISNSNPFVVHLGTALALSKSKFKNISIAETGDPYFYSQYVLAFYQKYIEKWTLSKFTYITVPVENAVNDYQFFGMLNKVKVVPHGFFLNEIEPAKFNPNDILSFAFAGRLYKNIRNPANFLTYLVEECENINFQFILFTDLRNKDTLEILTPFITSLSNKLIIRPMLPRVDCIEQLSQMDFLVNFNNDTNNQTPSKLVDYTLAKRPIISMSNNFCQIESEIFNEYIDKNYTSYVPIDISDFDIQNVVKKFEGLF